VRARDLFYGLWVNDLFMRRVEANAEWSLFCPNEAPGLAECWGEAFDALYQKFEREGRAKRVIKAQQLWFAILEAQVSEFCCLMHLCLRYLPEVQCPAYPTYIVTVYRSVSMPCSSTVCNIMSALSTEQLEKQLLPCVCVCVCVCVCASPHGI